MRRRSSQAKAAGAADKALFTADETVSYEHPRPPLSAQQQLRCGDAGPNAERYSAFYRALGVLREEFHRIGEFDDANAKLDELCKLLALRVLDSRHPLRNGGSRLSMGYLSGLAESKHGGADHLAGALHSVFSELSARYPAELSTFGPRSGLQMRKDDDAFARALVPLLEALPADATDGREWLFDGINEAFGHFVQDSFRNRKEDAQYMTPPEVVSAAADIAFTDILEDIASGDVPERFVVADPTCGVGSFLAAAYRRALHIELADGPLSRHLELFGQDKVERMVRLATANLRVFAGAEATLRQGNSVVPAASLDDIAGRVDLILTNPPFGASFTTAEVLAAARPAHFPTLCRLAAAGTLPRTLDSEYILLDREIALLRPGGRLLMVVPDHVVSGNGFSEGFRRALLEYADLVGVLDLPTEAFAQAGTRTKTSVVYLRRPRDGADARRPHRVFMAVSDDLGFRVTSRKGASVKQIVGRSDSAEIVAIYRSFRERGQEPGAIVCLSQTPSVSAVAPEALLNGRWTAKFYRAERLAALADIAHLPKGEFEEMLLPEVAEIDAGHATRVLADDKNRCISVLHVREDGSIDLRAVDTYRPSTPCVRCQAGDVLLSKINPRIKRVCVVPETRWELACSSEFAVLTPKLPHLSAWALALLLRSGAVQSQLCTLTSGTSSSHNRVKDQDLLVVRIPVPRPGTQAAAQLSGLGDEYKSASAQHYASASSIARAFADAETLLGPESKL